MENGGIMKLRPIKLLAKKSTKLGNAFPWMKLSLRSMALD